MITKRRVKHLSLALLTTLFLSACGGSSGEDKKELQEPSVDVTGSVSLGLIASANVEVWHVVNDVMPSQSSYSASTNALGEFSFVHKGESQGLLYVEISGNNDSTSLLSCYLVQCGESLDGKLDTNSNGLVDFGEQMVMPETLLLTAWMSAPFTKKLNVNLATHMVASQFSHVPTSTELQGLNDEVKMIYALEKGVDKLSAFDANTANDVAKVSDHITLLSLLDLSETVDLLDAIEHLTGTFYQENKDQQLVLQSANAIKIAEKLLLFNTDNAEAQVIVENLQAKNKAIAEEKNMLSAEELPISLPVL